MVGSGKTGNADNETRSTSPSRFMPRPTVRLGDDIHLEPREMPAVNPLVVTLDSQSAYDTIDVRVMQEVQDVRARLDTLAPGQAQSDAVLRGELAEALQLTAGLTPFAANDLLFGQPIETITIQPTLRLNPQPGGWNYDVGGTNLRNPVQVLQNNQLIGTIPVGADTGARFSLQSGQYNIVLRDAVTHETLGTAVLKTYGSSINVLSKNIPQPAAYQQTKPLVATTSVPVARAELDALFVDLSEVWTPSASTILTQAELIAARTRLLAGTANDETAMKNALLAQPGVEAVVTPTLAFQVSYNNNGGRVLIVDGANLPEGSRLVFSSDAGLLNVLDERSFLPGSNHAEVAVGPASYVGLVDASGDLLGQSFSLSVESGYLMVRRGQTVVGMTGNTFDPAAIPGVFVPLTKDSLTAVSPQARLIVSGQSADLRFEWLPAGAIIEGLTDTPIVAAGGALNVPIFVANGTQRAVTVRAADGTELMDRHMVGSNGQGGFIFYRPTSGQTQFITSREFGPAALATREQTRAVQVGRTVSTRLNPVFPSGSTEVTRAWGLMVAGLAGVDLAQTRSQIARQHSALVALWEDDREGFYAEVNRRYEATPIQSGRKIETAGMIESRMKGEVFDAYARADQAIQDALPVLGDLTLAAYLNVQATRTDTSTPPNLAQVRNYTAQARNAAALLPSDTQLLTAIGAHFDTIRSYLAGETTNWRNEINEASIAGRISSNPNPGGGELPRSQELIAYETALSAVSEAERQLRLASAAGEPRRLSAAKVTLVTAQAKLVTAEAAYRLWQKEQADKSDVKPVPLDGEQILTVSKSALERLLATLPGKILNVEARLQTTTDQRLRQDLVAERAHWLALQEAATGLLALVPANGTYPTIVGTQAQGWARYVSESVSGGLIQRYSDIGGASGDVFDEAVSTAAQANEALAVASGWYDYQKGIPGNWLGTTSLQTTTVAGRLLAGYLQKRGEPGNDLRISQLAAATGIPVARITSADASLTSLQRLWAFMNLWREANFTLSTGDITGQSMVVTPDQYVGKTDSSGDVLNSEVITYPSNATYVRLRLDLPAWIADDAAISVQVYNQSMQTVPNLVMSGVIRQGLTLLVPVGNLPVSELGRDSNGVTTFGLTISIGQYEWSTQLMKWARPTAPISESIPDGSWSTLLPEDPNRAAELAVLSSIVSPPLRLGEHSWSVTLGSGAHENNAFNAIDLNFGSENDDYGVDILAVADGTITYINPVYGQVFISHLSNAAAGLPNWQSVYLHMPLVATGEERDGSPVYKFRKKDGTFVPDLLVWKGMPVLAGTQIGIVGGRGTDINRDYTTGNEGSLAFKSHLHFEVRMNSQSINLSDYVRSAWSMPVSGDDGPSGNISIHWTHDVDIAGLGGAYVNDELRIIFFRDPTITADLQTDIWLAWSEDPANRIKIVQNGTIWVDATDDQWQWNPIERAFFNRITGSRK